MSSPNLPAEDLDALSAADTEAWSALADATTGADPSGSIETEVEHSPVSMSELGVAALSGAIEAGPAEAAKEATSESGESALRIIPSFTEQATDPTLTGSFKYVREVEALMFRQPKSEAKIVKMDEHEGLLELRDFLSHFKDTIGPSDTPEDMALAKRAGEMIGSLTYIGERELETATADIALQWKEYLNEDPSRQLFTWAKDAQAGTYKSSNYILDRTLAHFSDDEMARYQGRLLPIAEITPGYNVTDDELPPLPAKYKIVMVDDWVGTGRQLSIAYGQEIEDRWRYGEPPRVEVQLITANRQMATDGLTTNSYSNGVNLPVRAVYETPMTASGDQVVTGIHSSTDDTFEVPIAEMVASLRQDHNQPEAVMPPLTNIIRPYRQDGYETTNVARLNQAA